VRISTKGEYGIRAMMELACRYGDGYVRSAKIAGARAIPENYLYQLLITLRKAGLIRSRRGPKGGHMLSRPPGRINLAEVIVALEGPLAPASCADDGAHPECRFFVGCPVRQVWERITVATRDILEATSLETLVADEKQGSPVERSA